MYMKKYDIYLCRENKCVFTWYVVELYENDIINCAN